MKSRNNKSVLDMWLHSALDKKYIENHQAALHSLKWIETAKAIIEEQRKCMAELGCAYKGAATHVGRCAKTVEMIIEKFDY